MSAQPVWVLEKDQCVSCGVCADLCPEQAIAFSRTMAYPEQRPERCTGCGTCDKECPVEAIRILAVPDSMSVVQFAAAPVVGCLV